tara:strand:- start:981 stop:1553 length:573 start_codon:yes stop_codon:yes gene_type:complete
MKVFIAVLVLIFSFQSLTKADDIRDFQIEGMSIGDSLLDYYTREEIKNFIQDKQYPNSQRIKITNIKSDFFETYERVSADIIDDDTFVIVKLSGRLIYEDDIEECHKQMILIDNDLKKIFSAEKRYEGEKKHRYDKSGNSTMKIIGYSVKNDDIQIQCTDWTKLMAMNDNLTVMIASEEWMNFLDNEAYK